MLCLRKHQQYDILKYFTVISLLLELPVDIFGRIAKNRNLFGVWSKRNKMNISINMLLLCQSLFQYYAQGWAQDWAKTNPEQWRHITLLSSSPPSSHGRENTQIYWWTFLTSNQSLSNESVNNIYHLSHRCRCIITRLTSIWIEKNKTKQKNNYVNIWALHQ